MTPPLWQKAKKNWRASWWKWKRRVEKLAFSSTFRKRISWHLVPSLHGKLMGKQWLTLFWGDPKSLQMVIEKMLMSWKESYDQPRQHIKRQWHYFANKGPSSQGYGFSSSHVWMCELDYKESWVQKNWCFWAVVLEKTLESPLDCKEIQPIHPKGDQSWVFIGKTDAEAETPILWHLMWRADSFENTLLLGKIEGRGRRGWQRMRWFGWHHWLDEHGFG